MNPTLILSVLSALAAGVWSVWTWSEEQQREREIKRDQEAALFVNSFIVVTEELQSRLYAILEEDELAFYKGEYPGQHELASPAAIKILYHLSLYFGWSFQIYRYGPYTNDARVVALTREIGKVWGSRSFPGEAFRLSIEERFALGEAGLRRVGEVTSILPVFESITLFQFEKEMSDKLGKYTQLFQSAPVLRILQAIDRTDQAEDLEGHERLAALQNLFVDLLVYLEGAEGFHVSPKRKRARIRAKHAHIAVAQSTMARIIHQTRGRIRLGIPRLKTDRSYANHLQSLLESMENVTSIRISAAASSVTICYTLDISDVEFTRTVMQTIEGASCC